MSVVRKSLRLILILVFVAALFSPLVLGDDWQPINPAELQMTSEPLAPGASAIILYRQVDRDDTQCRETDYLRTKILTEEGRKYADVELPFLKEEGHISGLKARTIEPDGSIVNFSGKAFDKMIVKARGMKYLAKTFAMPDVRVGSIIEYRYVFECDPNLAYNSKWILSEDLFTKKAQFSLKSAENLSLRWSWPVGLPPGSTAPKQQGDYIRMESQNIPAFVEEDYMPPENELKFRVDFVYSDSSIEKIPDKFWKEQGKKMYGQVESFINKKKAMEQAARETVAANDPPEEKLRKLYARVQKIRNTSFEEEKTEQEEKREKKKDINNVEDIWKQGYGSGYELTWLFLALARGAGFDAYPVRISTRDQYFFKINLMNARELNSNVVLVKLNGKDLYLDPGMKLAPYGMLPWSETMVQGRLLDKDGGSWVSTPLPNFSESQVLRNADLKLDESSGSLEGKLTVKYTGLEALRMRLWEINEDETARKKFIEETVRSYIPASIEVELKNKPDWDNSSPELVAEFDLKIPGWIAAAGRRALMPMAIFGATEKHVFEHADRVHSIYFNFPFEKIDTVKIDLPLGWKASSIPAAINQYEKGAVGYSMEAEDQSGTLLVKRKMRIDVVMLETKYYGVLQNFFKFVRTGDEQQIVLQPLR